MHSLEEEEEEEKRRIECIVIAMQDGGAWGQACGMRRRPEPRGAHALAPGGRGTFRIQIIVLPFSPETRGESFLVVMAVFGAEWGGLFLGYLL